MRDTTNGTQRNLPGRKRSSASLSVVVVSSGPSHLAQQATNTLQLASADFGAQLIVVSQDNDPAFATSVARSGAELVVAPAGCSRAEMCDLGMKRVHGSIVAVRDDVTVGDAKWLAAYRAVLPRREAPVEAAPRESVVMNTTMTRKVALADAPASFSVLDSMPEAASIEMASAL